MPSVAIFDLLCRMAIMTVVIVMFLRLPVSFRLLRRNSWFLMTWYCLCFWTGCLGLYVFARLTHTRLDWTSLVVMAGLIFAWTAKHFKETRSEMIAVEVVKVSQVSFAELNTTHRRKYATYLQQVRPIYMSRNDIYRERLAIRRIKS